MRFSVSFVTGIMYDVLSSRSAHPHLLGILSLTYIGSGSFHGFIFLV